MTRHTAVLVVLAATLTLARPAAAAPRDGWPDTPAGRMGRQWVEAFSSGEEAMREFNRRNLAASSLAARGIEERTAGYRKLRDRFGRLMFGSVVKSQPCALDVKLIGSDASTQAFRFTVEKQAPHKLITVGMLERHGHFGGFHH